MPVRELGRELGPRLLADVTAVTPLLGLLGLESGRAVWSAAQAAERESSSVKADEQAATKTGLCR